MLLDILTPEFISKTTEPVVCGFFSFFLFQAQKLKVCQWVNAYWNPWEVYLIFLVQTETEKWTFFSLYKTVLLQGMRKIEPCIFDKSQLISSLTLCSVLLCHPPPLLIFYSSSKDLSIYWAWKLPLWQVHVRRCYCQAMSHSQLLHFSNYINLAEIPI